MPTELNITVTVDIKVPSLQVNLVGIQGSQGLQGPAGADGDPGPAAGFQLQDPIYIHPTSRREYRYIAGLYYEVTRSLVDGFPNESVNPVGVVTPV